MQVDTFQIILNNQEINMKNGRKSSTIKGREEDRGHIKDSRKCGVSWLGREMDHSQCSGEEVTVPEKWERETKVQGNTQVMNPHRIGLES